MAQLYAKIANHKIHPVKLIFLFLFLEKTKEGKERRRFETVSHKSNISAKRSWASRWIVDRSPSTFYVRHLALRKAAFPDPLNLLKHPRRTCGQKISGSRAWKHPDVYTWRCCWALAVSAYDVAKSAEREMERREKVHLTRTPQPHPLCLVVLTY